MRKLIYAVFWIGVLGLVLAFLGKLSPLGIWVVTGIFFLVVVLIIIREIKRKKIIPMIITIGLILTAQSYTKAQSFEELQKLSNENSTILQEIKPGESGQYGAITISADEGSAGSWIEVSSPKYHFSGYKSVVTGVQGSKVSSPKVSIGKVHSNISLLLIQTYTDGFISGEKSLYLIDSINNSSLELFIPGYIVKIFEKQGLIFIDSQVDEYHNQTYTQIYTTLSIRGETIISTAYQREVVSKITK
jgi:hypothetical protein